MGVLWNKVLTWVTNCFYSTPVSILPCKACLPPLESLLPHKRKLTAFKMACLSPLIKPAAKMPAAFPANSQKWATESLCPPLVRLKENYLPLRWYQHRPVPAVQFHLPIDAMCYSLCPVVAWPKPYQSSMHTSSPSIQDLLLTVGHEGRTLN